jgi:hypothetical protein
VPAIARVDLCSMSRADVSHAFWDRLGASVWADGRTVSMREAIGKVGHGSTAGAKMIAAGVLPTVSAPGYQNPRVSLASVELLNACPTLQREELGAQSGTLIVRCGGPQRSGTPGEPWDPETGRSYYGFHRTMTVRQVVHATAGWWSLPPRTLGLPGAHLSPGERVSVGIDRLLVTVGSLVVLDGAVDHAVVSADPVDGHARPLVAFQLSDPTADAVGTWLPPTRSGNVALRAVDW